MPENDKIKIGFDPSKQIAYLQGNNKPNNLGIEPTKQLGLNAPTYGQSKYDIPNLTPEQDLESGNYRYNRGERQSNLEKWGAGITKAVAKMGVRTVNGVVSPLYGIGSSLANWDISKLWDNDVTEITANIEKKIDNEIGVYSTKAAEDAKGFAKLAYVNFWANDVLDGISYSGAAMLSGGLYAKALKGIGSLAMFNKLNKVDDAVKGLELASDQIQYVNDLKNKTNLLKDGIKNGTIAALGASTEASVEAYNGANEWEKQMIERLSTNPDGSIRDLTDEELNKIKELRKSVGNAQYALNLPVIMASNWLTFGKAMLGNKSTERATLKELGEYITKDATDEVWKKATISNVRNIINKTYGARKALGKAIPEGFEELEQFAVEKGTNDYYTKKYYNPDNASFIESMSAGINAAMTQEGLENFLVGAISGGIFGNVTSIKSEGLKSYKNPYNDNVINNALDYINSIKGKDAFKQTVEMLNRHANISEELEKNFKEGKEFDIANNRSDMFVNYVNHMINMGKTNELRDELESYKRLSQDQFEEVLGIKLDNKKGTALKESVNEYIDKRLNKISKIEDLSNKIDELFPNVKQNIKDRMLYNSWSLEDVRERTLALNQEVKDIIANEISIANEGTLINSKDFQSNDIKLNTLRTDYVFLADQKARKEYKDLIKELNITPFAKDRILNKIEDLDKLKSRRDQFVFDYKTLSNPTLQEVITQLDDEVEKQVNDSINIDKADQKHAEDIANATQEEQQQHLTDILTEASNTQDHFELQKLAREAFFNPLLTDEQKQFLQNRYEEIAPLSIRRNQVKSIIDNLSKKEQSISEELSNIKEEISNNEKEADDIIKNYYEGNLNISAKKFEKILSNTAKKIDTLESIQKDLEKSLDNVKLELERRKDQLANNNIDIQNTISERDLKVEEYNKIKDEIDSTKKQISGLKKLYNDLVKIFKSLFPNYESELLKGRHKVVEANQELQEKKIDTNKAIKELNAKVKELNDQLLEIAEQGKVLSQEIEDYKKLLTSTKLDVFSYANSKEDFVSAEGGYIHENSQKAISEYDPKAKKDIREALTTTAGNNVIGEGNELTKDEDQKRWFAYTSNMSLSKKSNYSLRPITVNNNPFGDKVKFFDNEDIVVVLHSNGDPVLVNDKLVFTSIRKPILGTDDVVLKTLKDKFTNKSNLTDAQILSINDDLKRVREKIFNSKEPIFLPVTGKSRGIYIKDNTTTINGETIYKFPVIGRLKESEEDIDDIIAVVAKETKTVIGRYTINTNPGVVLFAHNHNILQGRVSKLNEIPGAVDKVIELIKELKQANDNQNNPEYKGRIAKQIFDDINLLTLFGNYQNNSKYKIFFSKDGMLFYNGQMHSVINEQELKDFLGNKYFRVNGALLEKNGPVVDPITGKEYSSYKKYLMSSEGRTAKSVPLGVSIVPLGQQQFLNVGLRFNLSELKDPISAVVIPSNTETIEQDVDTNVSSKVQNVKNDIISKFNIPELFMGLLTGNITKEQLYDEIMSRGGLSTDNQMYNKFKEIAEELGKPLTVNNQEKLEDKKYNIEVISENYTPELLRANPNKLFLFGDNNQRSGKGGQAIIRDEFNAIGISTKLLPKNTPEAFMSDDQLTNNKAVIDSDIKKAKERAAKEDKTIVLPKGGFGTGLASLATKAPQTFAYLNQRLQEEFGFNNTTGELVALEKQGVEGVPAERVQLNDDGSTEDNDTSAGDLFNEALQNIIDNSSQDPNDFNKNFVEGEVATKEQLDVEQKWFEQNFPQIPYERVKGLIDSKVMGRFLKAGKVLLSDRAVPGVTYHEAFHVVSQLFLSEKELSSLYSEYKKRSGKSNLTSLQVEEELADLFMSYMMGDPINLAPVEKTLFQKILSFLKNLLGIIDNSNIENVFSNIKQGKYKSSKPLRFGKTDLNKSNLPGKDSAWNRDLMESVTTYFFKHLMKNDGNNSIDNLFDVSNKDLFKNIYENVHKDILTQFNLISKANSEAGKKLESDYRYIHTNWEAVKTAHLKYLTRFGLDIKLTIDNSNNESKENDGETEGRLDFEDLLNEIDRVKDTTYIDTIQFSSKDNAPKSIKLLIASLPQVKYHNGSLKAIVNRFGMPKSVDHGKLMNYLHNNLAGIQSYQKMIEKLDVMKLVKPEINILLKYLKSTSEDPTPVSLTEEQFRLQRQFFQQYAKTINTYLTTMIDNEGNVYSFDANSSKLGDRIKDKWINDNVKSKYNDPNGIYSSQNGVLILNKNQVKNLYKQIKDNDIKTHIEFLNKLGITFSTDKFTEEEEGIIKNFIIKFNEYVINDPNVTSIFQKGTINSIFNDLVNIEAGYTNDVVELQHINPEGKTVYSVTLNTYLSLLVNEFNNDPQSSKLLNLDYNKYAKNSLFREMILKGTKIKLNVAEGLKPNIPGEDGQVTSDLGKSDMLLQHINYVLSNKFPFLRAGDKRLEYLFEINLDIKDVEKFKDILVNYYQDELERISELQKGGLGNDIQYYNKNGLKSLMFEGMEEINALTEKFDVNKTTPEKFIAKHLKDIRTSIEKYQAKRINALRNELLEYNLISLNKDNTYSLLSIDKTVLNKYIGNKQSYSEREVYILLQQAVMKNFIATVEQTKLFTGDISNYKVGGDLHKRTGGLTGPKKVVDTDPSTNEWLNNNYKRSDGKIADGKVNTIVYDDITVESKYFDQYLEILGKDKEGILSAYKAINEADAQGYITLDEYREFLSRSGEWTPQHSKAYNKAIKGQRLTEQEFQFFMPLKPQYFGPQEYEGLYVPTYYKLSLIPLLPGVVKDRQISKLLDNMTKNKVGIAMFSSANKVGHKLKNGKSISFYGENGEINKELPAIQTIDYKYIGIQLDIAPIEKNKVTFGTQFRKLILSNLYSNGNFKTITVERNNKPVEISSEELVNKYSDTINKLTELKRNKLIKRLTLEELSNGDYKINDFDVFRKILLSEAESRDSINNLIDSIELALTSDNKILDGTLAKNKIEQILFSVINNNVISQKVLGDMKVQAASSGFELKARKFNKLSNTEKKNITWLSNSETLGFYYKKDNGITSDMEVLVPHYFKEIIGNIDINTLNNDKQKELLEAIGFRIPTQGLNSIESIKIVGFLPKESGNTIIVPSEITAKAGSDFDVDKLTIFFKNYIIVNGLPYHLPKTEEGLKKLYEYVKESDKNFKNSFEEFYNDNYEKLLQNRIIDLSRDILKAPENFESLITPNSVDNLKSLVSKIRKNLKESSSRKGTDAFDIIHNVNTAISFWSGKAGVGVSALHNTHHILSQIANLAIRNPETYINFDHNMTENGLISLAGNKDVKGINKISDIISEFLNAYVDIAKDPFIFDLNAGIQTANVWLYLVRAGVPLDTIGAFMRQPIVWDYIKMQSINESAFKEASENTKSKNDILKELRKKYQPNAKVLATNGINYSEKQMLDFIKSYSENSKLDNDFYNAQLQFLNDFIHYQDTAKMLSDLQNATSSDTKGLGKNRNAVRQTIKAIEDVKSGYLNEFFLNASDIIEKTPIKEFANSIEKGSKFFNELFLTENVKVREVLNVLEKSFEEKGFSGSLIEELMDLSENEFINYILQNGEVDGVKLNSSLQDLFYGTQSLANRINNIKKDIKNPLSKNLLIENLFPIINSNRNKQDNIKFFSKKMNTYDQNILTDAYNELYSLNPKLANDLTKLAIMQSGIGNSPINFINVVPADRYFEIAENIVSTVLNSDIMNLSKFIDMFYQNNYANNKIVRKLSNYAFNNGTATQLSDNAIKLNENNYLVNDPYIKTISLKPELKNNETLKKSMLASGESIYDIKVYKNIGGGLFEQISTKGEGFRLKDYRDNLTIKETKVFTENKGSENLAVEEKKSNFTNRELTPIDKASLMNSLSKHPKGADWLNILVDAKTIEDLKDNNGKSIVTVNENGVIILRTDINCK